jgi:hypothetical protein
MEPLGVINLEVSLFLVKELISAPSLGHSIGSREISRRDAIASGTASFDFLVFNMAHDGSLADTGYARHLVRSKCHAFTSAFFLLNGLPALVI